jgi:hypothetical protein
VPATSGDALHGQVAGARLQCSEGLLWSKQQVPAPSPWLFDSC